MFKCICSFIGIAGIIFSSCTKIPQLGEDSVEDILAAMTIEEKALLVVGTGWGHEMSSLMGDTVATLALKESLPGAAGFTYPIPRLGIPGTIMVDGPAGVRIEPRRLGDTLNTYYGTAFPIETLLASTWNTKLVESVGDAMGKETLEYGADVLLAPALNIHRNPLCGRNYEYYSEDPYLTGKMAAAMVCGIQSNGVGASVKHFVANNQESYRFFNDARVSQRALREIYLKGFEIVVKEAKPWTVMSSYNRLNGSYTSESRVLLTDILRTEWGFDGIVTTDWGGGLDAPAQIAAGNDLLQPGNHKQFNSILEAVKAGTLQEKELDVAVSRILNYIMKTPRFQGYKNGNKPNLRINAEITRQSAAEGMVLLKNESNTLPFDETKKIGAFGITFYDFISGGTGSGDVNEAYTVSVRDGMRNSGYQIDECLAEIYEVYLKENMPTQKKFIYSNPDPARIDEYEISEDKIRQTAAQTDIAMVVIGRNSGEGVDRKVDEDFNLSNSEQELIRNVCKVYHAEGKKVIVILNIGGVIETASWKTLPDAILLAWQPGQEGGNTIADIISGKVTPSGKLPMTFPNSYWDVPSANTFPFDFVEKREQSIEDSLFNITPNVGTTVYEEGIFVGYRYYDTHTESVSYPFGFGLSYTQFEYEKPELVLDDEHGVFIVKVTVKNSGKVAGKEIVQVYVSAPRNQDYEKPMQELKAFAKTEELPGGEAQEIIFKIPISELASFDETNNAWKVDKGTYTFSIGASSRDIRAKLQEIY